MTIRFFDHLDSTGALLAFTLPGDCIDDCSRSGDVKDAVRYWVRKLGFAAPEDGANEFLKAFGIWNDDELADHEANLERLLWLVCCDEAERFVQDARDHYGMEVRDNSRSDLISIGRALEIGDEP